MITFKLIVEVSIVLGTTNTTLHHSEVLKFLCRHFLCDVILSYLFRRIIRPSKKATNYQNTNSNMFTFELLGENYNPSKSNLKLTYKIA